ncbi:MAG TPA: hypothetical protein PLL23_10080 [Chitinophagaceae bacterium]|nr:hypothetical protein [Chitinophagaceae bacterium]
MNFIYFTLLFAYINCNPKITKQDDLILNVINSKPSLNYSSKNISNRILRVYEKIYHIKLVLSDPGSSYNISDVVYKKEPIGMLLFSGHEKNKNGFILFETRGVSSQCNFVYYKMKRLKVVEMKMVILKKQPKDFTELKNLVLESSYFR